MEKRIEYTTVEEQIALLKSRGLIIDDESFARDQLKTFGYYNLINNYESPYLSERNGEKIFHANTSFNQIFSLFTLDHNLRNSIMASMLVVEETIKAAAAEVISASFGINPNDYLKWVNYRDRRVSQERFSLNGVMRNLQRNLMSDKDPIRHYREDHTIVPPWILFKGTYFSTMVNFTRLFKEPQKREFVKLLYDCQDELCMQKDVKTLLFDTLSLCLEYRNIAAHGGRVYNHETNLVIHLDNPAAISSLAPIVTDITTQHGFRLLLNLLDILSYKQPYEIIYDALIRELNRHLSIYKDDLTFLSNTLNVTITLDEDT